MNGALEAFVNAAILSVPMTLAVWLALRFVPRNRINAAARYWIWWMLLAVVTLLPAVAYRSSRAGVLVTQSLYVARTSAPIVDGEETRPTPPLPGKPASLFPIRIPAGEWIGWIFAAWAMISGCMLARLAASWMALRRLGGAGKIRVSSAVTVPMAIGPFRRAILIPQRLHEELSEEEMRVVVLHESAHLKRYDDVALLLQRVVEAIFAPHPAVRWITRQIELEREIACDDIVIAETGEPKEYARCLTRVAELTICAQSLVAPAVVEGRSHLTRRIELLLDGSRNLGVRMSKGLLATSSAAVVAMGTLAAQTPVFLQLRPPDPVLAEIVIDVRDPTKRYVSGLTIDNFEVSENGTVLPVEQVIDLDSRPHAYAVVLPPGIDFSVADGMRQTIRPADTVSVMKRPDGPDPMANANAFLSSAAQPGKFILEVDASPGAARITVLIYDVDVLRARPLRADVRDMEDLRDTLSRVATLLENEHGYLLKYRTTAAVDAVDKRRMMVRIVGATGLPALTVKFPAFASPTR